MEPVQEQAHENCERNRPLAEGTNLHRRYNVRAPRCCGDCTLTYDGFDYIARQPVAILEFFPDGVATRMAGTAAVSPDGSENGELYFVGLDAFYRQYNKLMQTIGSPNIISVFDVFFENGTAYAVTEEPIGVTLSGYLAVQNRALTEGELVYIARALSDALLVVHACNTMHYGISEDTVLLCPDGTVKLTDFAAGRMTVQRRRALKENAPGDDIFALGETLRRAYAGDADALTALFSGMLSEEVSLRFASVFDLRYTVDSLDIPPVRPDVTPDNIDMYQRQPQRRIQPDAKIHTDRPAPAKARSPATTARDNRWIAALIGLVLLTLIGALAWVLIRFR